MEEIIRLRFRYTCKQKRCNECKGEFLCDDSNNQVNEKEEFGTNLNLLGQKAPNQFGHMLPCYKV